MPNVTDIPNGCGVLVKVLLVGVDGTDKEIDAAEYGMAPGGEKFLITGHENFGQVVEVGPNVPDTIKPGTYVVATVRRRGTTTALPTLRPSSARYVWICARNGARASHQQTIS